MKRRNTRSKAQILAALKKSKSALSHEMLQEALDSSIDRATIYRVLNRFCDDGQAHRIIGDDGKQYFALCLNCREKENKHSHNHFHFQCLVCGKVECLKNEIDVTLPIGYMYENFNGLVSGTCNSCS